MSHIFPVFNDDLIGLITTSAYFLVVLVTFHHSTRRSNGSDRRFWLFISLSMLILFTNKQFSLQINFTEFLRERARQDGWYRQRREYQLIFVVAVAVLSLPASGFLIWKIRDKEFGARLSALGLVSLFAFVAIRAGSFHSTDVLGSMDILGFKVHQIVELTGIALVGIGAMLRPQDRNGQLAPRKPHRGGSSPP